MSVGFGELVAPREGQQPGGDRTQTGDHAGRVAGADRGKVVIEADIEDPMESAARGCVAQVPSAPPGLVEMRGQVPDPHARRGVRHAPDPILAVASTAVLGGASWFTAIDQPAGEADLVVLGKLGVIGCRPSDATIRGALTMVELTSPNELPPFGSK